MRGVEPLAAFKPLTGHSAGSDLIIWMPDSAGVVNSHEPPVFFNGKG